MDARIRGRAVRPLILLGVTCLGTIFLGIGVTGQESRAAKGLFMLHTLSLLSTVITLSIATWAPQAGMSIYAPLALLGISCLSLLGLGIALTRNDKEQPEQTTVDYQTLTTTALTPVVYYQVCKHNDTAVPAALDQLSHDNI